jgi:hypothetical protein
VTSPCGTDSAVPHSGQVDEGVWALSPEYLHLEYSAIENFRSYNFSAVPVRRAQGMLYGLRIRFHVTKRRFAGLLIVR